MTGQTVSHFRLLEKLGAGGMGEVYLAEDTGLGRQVALKFLPTQYTSDPEAVRRFKREAKSAASLNHPNIVTVHEVGEHNGQTFIAMEYVKGESLRDRIENGVSLRETFDLMMQVCDGLSKAHRSGIIHRDIKPENIMIDEDERVRILDFGLAKLRNDSKLTKTAGTLGTVGYISPEQLQSMEVDARADVWSVGVVLYEMVAGEHPFRGDNEHAVMYSIVNVEPKSLYELNAAIPGELIRFIERALAKRCEKRFANAGAMAIELERIRSDIEGTSPAPARQLVKKSKKKPIFLTSGIAVATVLTLTMLARFSQPADKPVRPIRPIPFTTLIGSERTPSFSPHGNEIAFSWNGEDQENYDIYVKIVGNVEHQRLTDDPGDDISPAWSPDGRLIAFTRISDGEAGIYTIPARGGKETKLPVSIHWPQHWNWLFSHPLSWTPDGRAIAFSDFQPLSQSWHILQLDLVTMRIDTLTHPDIDSWGDRLPTFSPDGRNLAFLRGRGIYYYMCCKELPGGKVYQLTTEVGLVGGICWSADGLDLIFSTGGNLWRMPRGGGAANRILPDATQLAISGPAKRLAFVRSRGDRNIWRLDLTQTERPHTRPERLIATTWRDQGAAYSRDGKSIVYLSWRSTYPELWLCDQDGTNHRQLTFFRGGRPGSPSWSPDSRTIAFNYLSEGNKDIYIIAVDGGLPKRLTTRKTDDAFPRWSSDKRWIYFRSDHLGTLQIWKVSEQGGELYQVTQNGGFTGFESSDGDWFYFSKPDRAGIWSIPAAGGDESQVTDCPVHFRNWVLAKNGIYFVRESKTGFTIEFCDLQSNMLTIIAEQDVAIQSIDVSPDGRWLLYTEKERFESDIFLVEDFE